MDGVVADFVGGVFDMLNESYPDPPQERDIVKAVGWKHIEEQFWKLCDYHFWRTLNKTKEADFIVNECVLRFGRDNCCFLSTATPTLGCETGKKAWLKEYFPGIRSLMTDDHDAKKFCGHYEAVLIDDKHSNIIDFVKWGGTGILIPRPWNDAWESEGRLETILVNELDLFYERFSSQNIQSDRV
jgi:5'(3')-deoxyribonucleotidase